MRSLTSLILLGFVGIIIAADCNNPLLATFGLTGLANPTAVTGLKFCKGLQTSGQACCSADTINGFQTKVKDLTDKLATAMGKRDKNIAETRDKDIPNLKDKLKSLKDQAAKAVDKIKAKTADQKNADTSKVSDDGATKLIDSLKTISGKMNDNLPALKTDFKDFQKSRTSCVVQLVKLQAAAWCLACDPDYAAKGATGANAITLGDKACKRLQNNCFKFISGAASQSSIVSAQSISTIIDKLTASLTKIDGSDNSGKDDLKTALDSIGKNANAGTDKKAVKAPANCNSDSDCAWICSNFFKGAQIDQDVLTVGGDTDAGLSTDGVASGKRLLEEEDSFVQNKLSKRRVLQSPSFAPDEDEAGVAVTFQDDPAGVSQDSPATTNGSLLMKSGLVSLIVMLTAFLA